MRSLLACLLAPLALLAAETARPPNVILLFVDDLGYADIGPFGNKTLRTPHLDRFAREGMRFTSFYATPVCSMSRASLLTGCYSARVSMPGVLFPPNRVGLHPDEITLAEVAKSRGYATMMIGKWHVGHLPEFLPTRQGFDHYFGLPYSNDMHQGRQGFPPLPLYRDAQIIETEPDQSQLTRRYTEEAVRFLRAQRDQPFFLYLSHYYVHTPIHTRMRWLQEHHQARLPEGRAAYAAMVETLDHEVGRVLRTLDELGLAEKTLVVFSSDNGGHPEYSANGPLRGSKWNLHEAGVRVPFLVRWPGRVPAGRVSERPLLTLDLYATFAAAAGVNLERGLAPDAENLLPEFEGRATPAAERALVWHFPYYHPENKAFAEARRDIGVEDWAVSQTRPQSAIRLGRYKLLHFHEDGRDELYDLEVDAGEQRDQARQLPEKRAELRRRLDAYLREVKARMPTAAGANVP